jgi:L-ascorbate metabolism protein UlaG (beta-lactamase superfamily)
MRGVVKLVFIIAGLSFFMLSIAKEGYPMIENIHWLGHDTFRIEGEQLIYTDPFQIKKKDKADIILITHEHRDHCSPDDVKKIQGPDTVIVTPADCAAKLQGNIKVVKPGDKIEIKGITIEVVPSYNTNKQFHTKDRGWVGYVFTAKGKRIYIAGDTDYIPEMKNIKADIALLPVSGTYVTVMGSPGSLDTSQVAIPMHYGSTVGTKEDAKFAEKGRSMLLSCWKNSTGG